MERPRLSVVAIVRNEEDRIAPMLESVRFADEIVILDSFSQDRTLEIAARYTDRIHQRVFDNFSSQRNHATSLCSHDWVFFIDADERVTPELREAILSELGAGPAHAAYRVRRDVFFMEERVRFGGWSGNSVVRLMDRRRCDWGPALVHESVRTQGTVGRLAGLLEHHTYRGFTDYLQKLEHYSALVAHQKMARKKRRITLADLLLQPLVKFLKFYVWKLGFLDGKVGFIISVVNTWDTFLRYTMMWRIERGERFITEEQERSLGG